MHFIRIGIFAKSANLAAASISAASRAYKAPFIATRTVSWQHSHFSTFSGRLQAFAERKSLNIPDIRAPTISQSAEKITLHWNNSLLTTEYHHLWLRDNCQCMQCVHPSNRQKLFSSADIPQDIHPTSAQITNKGLEIIWSSSSYIVPHKSNYSLEFLQDFSFHSARNYLRSQYSDPVLWNSEEIPRDNLWTAYDDYVSSPESFYHALRQLHNYGLVFLKNVPVSGSSDAGILSVATKIGEIRNTFYGMTWDVKSIPQAKNIAYTSLFLNFHCDLLYFESPPGLQFLHCLQNTVRGGASIFVDAFEAARRLKEQNPVDYDILKRTPVTFHYINDGHHMHFRHPTLNEDPDSGELKDVFYAPPFQGPMEFKSMNEATGFYRAFKKYAEIIEDPILRFQLTLQPGELVIFANRRILHGRTEFDPTSGARHLKGTYVDWDAFKDRLRTARLD